MLVIYLRQARFKQYMLQIFFELICDKQICSMLLAHVKHELVQAQAATNFFRITKHISSSQVAAWEQDSSMFTSAQAVF